mmetsp:Transcript_39802/g.71753  ORF Transcript_39802/g.71753 Transcript_39802/m.71753 type:complete len:247 (+) Transcript_39802:744-1484(+)
MRYRGQRQVQVKQKPKQQSHNQEDTKEVRQPNVLEIPQEGENVSDPPIETNTVSAPDDWGDETWDHHFGMENHNTGGPYSNRGRSEAVWKTLVAYGFRRTPNNLFDGPTPQPCFECFVRQKVKNPANVLANGEIASRSTANLADRIRTCHHIGNGEKIIIDNMNENDLVKGALSIDGIKYTDLYYSFCGRGGLEKLSHTWHCRICKCCKDRRDWHCKGCNKCRYGVLIPCSKRNPRDYASWEKHGY